MRRNNLYSILFVSKKKFQTIIILLELFLYTIRRATCAFADYKSKGAFFIAILPYSLQFCLMHLVARGHARLGGGRVVKINIFKEYE